MGDPQQDPELTGLPGERSAVGNPWQWQGAGASACVPEGGAVKVLASGYKKPEMLGGAGLRHRL